MSSNEPLTEASLTQDFSEPASSSNRLFRHQPVIEATRLHHSCYQELTKAITNNQYLQLESSLKQLPKPAILEISHAVYSTIPSLLTQAIKTNNRNMVRLLISYSATKTPSLYIAPWTSDISSCPLFQAIELGNLQIVHDLIEHYPIHHYAEVYNSLYSRLNSPLISLIHLSQEPEQLEIPLGELMSCKQSFVLSKGILYSFNNVRNELRRLTDENPESLELISTIQKLPFDHEHKPDHRQTELIETLVGFSPYIYDHTQITCLLKKLGEVHVKEKRKGTVSVETRTQNALQQLKRLMPMPLDRDESLYFVLRLCFLPEINLGNSPRLLKQYVSNLIAYAQANFKSCVELLLERIGASYLAQPWETHPSLGSALFVTFKELGCIDLFNQLNAQLVKKLSLADHFPYKINQTPEQEIEYLQMEVRRLQALMRSQHQSSDYTKGLGLFTPLGLIAETAPKPKASSSFSESQCT